MSDDPLEYVPGYVSPLTDKEHARIGRIAILWGQIEFFVEELLTHVSGMAWEELEVLQVTSKTIASKVDYLDRIKARHHDPDYRQKVGDFCAIIHETKTSRNHVFHGVWGWRAEDRTKTMTPAARKSSAPNQPFRYTQLPALEKKLCKCSRMGADLCNPMWHPTARPKLTRYIHHGVEGPAPQWMRQWTERNPLADVVLESSSKAAQLPRLRVLFPQK
jgi:hypothetical protein